MDTEPIRDLVDALRAVDGLEADTESSTLRVPGVLVRVTGHRDDRLAGGTWLLQLVCVAPDNGTDRALDQLAATYTLLTTVLDPTGDATTVSVLMPDGPSLPGIAVPFDLPYT